MGRKTPVHWHEHINNSDALTSKTRREGSSVLARDCRHPVETHERRPNHRVRPAKVDPERVLDGRVQPQKRIMMRTEGEWKCRGISVTYAQKLIDTLTWPAGWAASKKATCGTLHV
jgi:hypothetical protein